MYQCSRRGATTFQGVWPQYVLQSLSVVHRISSMWKTRLVGAWSFQTPANTDIHILLGLAAGESIEGAVAIAGLRISVSVPYATTRSENLLISWLLAQHSRTAYNLKVVIELATPAAFEGKPRWQLIGLYWICSLTSNLLLALACNRQYLICETCTI